MCHLINQSINQRLYLPIYICIYMHICISLYLSTLDLSFCLFCPFMYLLFGVRPSAMRRGAEDRALLFRVARSLNASPPECFSGALVSVNVSSEGSDMTACI